MATEIECRQHKLQDLLKFVLFIHLDQRASLKMNDPSQIWDKLLSPRVKVFSGEVGKTEKEKNFT